MKHRVCEAIRTGELLVLLGIAFCRRGFAALRFSVVAAVVELDRIFSNE